MKDKLQKRLEAEWRVAFKGLTRIKATVKQHSEPFVLLHHLHESRYYDSLNKENLQELETKFLEEKQRTETELHSNGYWERV